MKPSSSTLERLEKCAASHVLPAMYREAGDAADRGTFIHRYIELMVSESPEAAKAWLAKQGESPFEWRAVCHQIPLPPVITEGLTDILCEASFSFDYEVNDVAYLGSSLNRNYKVTGTQFPGTADLAGTLDGVPYIADYKTGRNRVRPSAMQLLFLGYCWARHLQKKEVIVEVYMVSPDGNFYGDRLHIDEFALDEIGARLRKMGRNLAAAKLDFEDGRTPDTTVGDHCTYCPSIPYCPSYRALSQTFASYDPQELTPRTAAALYSFAGVAKRHLEVLDKGIKSYVSQFGAISDEGWKLSIKKTSRRQIDSPLADAYLVKTLAANVYQEISRPKYTISDLEKMLQASGKDAPYIEEVFKGLENAGAINHVEVEKLGVVKP